MIGPGTVSRRSAPLCSNVLPMKHRVKLAVLWQPAFYGRFPLPGGVERYVKEGVLTRIDLAWSRDQKKKFTYKTNYANRARSCGAGQ